MTRDTLNEEAPSRNDTFAKKIARIIKPRSLSNNEPGHNDRDTGVEIWKMICSAITGDLQTIQEMVAKNPDLAICDYYYYQPIQFAVREGHTETVRFLLDHGADPSYTSYHFKDSLLTIASDRRHEDLVRLLEDEIKNRSQGFSKEEENEALELIDAVADRDYGSVAGILEDSPSKINAANSEGSTALHKAVQIGDFYLVRFLVERGADVHAQGGRTTSAGSKPIHHAIYASRRHQPELYENRKLIIGYLLGKGTKYNILVASALGDVQQVRAYLEEDAGLANFRDTCGRVPLSIAAKEGHKEIIVLLLENGADPNAPEIHAPGGGALREATLCGHPEIASTLLDHGADPNAHADSTAPPVKFAGRYPGLLEKMVAHGGVVDPIWPFRDALNEDDMEKIGELLRGDPDLIKGAGLDRPARRGRLDVIKFLVNRGATIDEVENPGWGYLDHMHIGKYLLENKILRPNLKNWLGSTILHQMARQGDIERAGLLLDHGANINAMDTERCSTPLGWASRDGQTEMVQFLIDRGADVDLPTDEPWATPLAWAKKKGHSEIAEILRIHGASG